ncbi:MAG: GHKL domain-containing protein [Desulfobulbaceae bacterium]|nr:GHKL domain-containing protein [Desulfobulbaceae bacterium]
MTMWKKKGQRQNTLLDYSPWILSIACLLLLVLLAFFAVTNFQREKELISESLEQKGLTIMRFVGSSAREAVRANMRSSSSWQKWDVHMQDILNLAAEQPGVNAVLITDDNRKVLLGAGKSFAEGAMLSKDEMAVASEIYQEKGVLLASRLIQDAGNNNSRFLVATKYLPPMLMGNGGGSRGRGGRFSHHPHYKSMKDEMGRLKDLNPVFIVELDFDQFDTPLKRQFLQIVLQLIIIVLVGVGGGLSFLTLRGLKGSERNLGNVRAFTDSMVSSLPVGLLATDSEGVIQVCNGAACTILEKEKNILLGEKPVQILHAEVSEMLAGELSKEGEIEAEVILQFTENRQKAVHLVSRSVVDNKGNFSGEVLLIRDLTELKDLEKLLHRNERFAALGKMAAGVAHEIRNPLSSIKGLALLLKAHFEQGSLEYSNTDTLVKEVDRLNRSIGELLDFAKPAQLIKEQLVVNDIIEKTIQLVELDAKSYQITIENHCNQERCTVHVDGDKLSQVLLNLFLNGIQALTTVAEDKSKVIAVHLKRENDLVQICIRDSGEGVTPQNLKKVFDPYFTTKNDGTGLGLALSAKIIEEHGGRIEISSEPGVFTEVRVSLPLAP